MFPLLIILAHWAKWVYADYHIDDRNSSVEYTRQFSQDPDTGAYNGTLTLASGCLTTDECEMVVPFTGSGITLYLAHGQDSVNSVILVDNVHLHPSTVNIPIVAKETYNVTLFNVQGLLSGNHNISVYLQDYTFGVGSDLWFDYALVNETQVAPPTSSHTSSTSSHTSSTSPPTSTSTKHSSIGPIVGGVVGGVIVIIAGVLLAIFFLRRKRNSEQIDMDEAKPWHNDALLAQPNITQFPPSINHGAQSSITSLSRSQTPIQPSYSGNRKGAMPSRASGPVSTPMSPSDSTTSGPYAAVPRHELTDDQADLVRGLWAANMPPTHIARVIERIHADAQEGSSHGVHTSGSVDGTILDPPPVYGT